MRQRLGRLSRTARVFIVLVVVVVLAAAVVAAALLTRVDSGSSVKTAAAEPALLTPAPGVAAVPTDAAEPSASGVAVVVAPAAANPALGTFAGQIVDAQTGSTLWQQGESTPMTPASTTKILTAAAALLALPHDHRVTTTVVAGSEPGQVILVGAGDPTLSAQPDGSPTFYADAPRIADLAAALKARGGEITKVSIDINKFTGPGLAQGWSDADIAGGSLAPIEALTTDGARVTQPLVDESPRSATPSLDAGRALAQSLGLDPATVGTAAASSTQVLASVQSAPLQERLGEMLTLSDNVLTEAVAREIAIAKNRTADFTSAVTAVQDTLTAAGFDLGGIQLHDTSGLSVDDRIPPKLLAAVLTASSHGDDDRARSLRPLLDFLPVAGSSGTLATRFDTGDRAAAGFVRAKTGTLSGVNALAGVVTDADGRVLTFALMSAGSDNGVARPALDAVAAALRTCGCR